MARVLHKTVRRKTAAIVSLLFVWGIGIVLLCLSCAGTSSDGPGDPTQLKRAALQEIAALSLPPRTDPADWEAMKAELERCVSSSTITFGPPKGELSKVTDLAATDQSGLVLSWSYRNSGDYDQNGEVNASDLTPMGPALLKDDTDPLWLRWQLADGDINGEVNISDITPIGANFRSSVESYEIQFAAAEDSSYTPVALVALAEAQIPETKYRKKFTFVSPSAGTGWYRVVPRFQGSYGIPSDPVQYIKNNVPVAMVTADQIIGIAPLTVTFDASGSSDDGSLLQYEWDFDGNGIYEETTTLPSVTHEYSSGGTFGAVVKVMDDNGATDTASVAVVSLQWQFAKLDDYGDHFASGALSYLGLPQCIYEVAEKVGGFNRYHTWFALGQSALPTGPTEWDRHEVLVSTDSVMPEAFIQVQSKPCLLLLTEPVASLPRVFKLCMAKVPMPNEPDDWAVSDTATYYYQAAGLQLMELNGRPALASYDENSNEISFWAAKVDVPTGPSDWDISKVATVESLSAIVPMKIAVLNGKPVLAYVDPANGDLHTVCSAVEHPITATDWTDTLTASQGFQNLDGLAVCEQSIVLLTDDGSDPGLGSRVYSSHTPSPATPADWTSCDFPELQQPAASQLLDVNGRPIIWTAIEDNGEYWFYVGVRSDPQSASDWVKTKVPFPITGSDLSTPPFGFTSQYDGLAGAFNNRNGMYNEMWCAICPIQPLSDLPATSESPSVAPGMRP